MAAFVASICTAEAIVLAAVLTLGGVAKIRDGSVIAVTLRGLLPARLSRFQRGRYMQTAGQAWGGAELLTAGSLLLLTKTAGLVAAIVTAFVFLFFVGVVFLAIRRQLPCGCGQSSRPASRRELRRTAALAVLATTHAGLLVEFHPGLALQVDTLAISGLALLALVLISSDLNQRALWTMPGRKHAGFVVSERAHVPTTTLGLYADRRLFLKLAGVLSGALLGTFVGIRLPGLRPLSALAASPTGASRYTFDVVPLSASAAAALVADCQSSRTGAVAIDFLVARGASLAWNTPTAWKTTVANASGTVLIMETVLVRAPGQGELIWASPASGTSGPVGLAKITGQRLVAQGDSWTISNAPTDCETACENAIAECQQGLMNAQILCLGFLLDPQACADAYAQAFGACMDADEVCLSCITQIRNPVGPPPSNCTICRSYSICSGGQVANCQDCFDTNGYCYTSCVGTFQSC